MKHDVFVTQPYSGESTSVSEIIQKVANRHGHDIFRSSNILSGNPVDFINSVKESFMVIADITGGDPNVMYEVGVSIAYDKIVVLLSKDSRSIPYNLSKYSVVIYDDNDEDSLFHKLNFVFTEVRKNPDKYLILPEETQKKSVKKNNVFIIYSHKDKEYLSRILVHLKPLENENKIDLWVDERIKPGDKWQQEIEIALDKSNVAILVISADFLASDFIVKNELPPLLKKAQENGTRIIPIIAKPSRFKRDVNIKGFQAINNPDYPLILLSEGEQETVYNKLADEIERVSLGK